MRAARLWLALAALWAAVPSTGLAQTPSPLQEWQYSAGVALYQMFQPDMPDWQIETGAAVEPRPLWEGSKIYRVVLGPVIDVRYRDAAFASVGEGLGYNVLHSENFRLGIALGYDLGRRADDDLTHLKGMGNISSAPVAKLFGSYVLSKSFPLVLRVDVRQFVGGANGVVGDVNLYMPLPGSSENLVMFAGPSVTLADRLYMQTKFGVSPDQALASGYPDYRAHGGFNSAGFGVSITRFIGKRWLIDSSLAANRLLGSADESPITQTRVQGVVALSFAYKW
jgi:outer membrane scaffolding protein for murein synthesis (MipA/OmpV family)